MVDSEAISDGETFLKTLVTQLLQEVQGLKQQISDQEVFGRLDDVEQQLGALNTEVRLQARRSNLAASQLHLNLGQLGSNSTCGSPRVAGPLSPSSAVHRATSTSGPASASPRAMCSAAPESLHGTPRSWRDSNRQQPSAASNSSLSGHATASGVAAGRSPVAALPGGSLQDNNAGSAGTPPQKSSSSVGVLGVFDTVKHWKEDVLDNNDPVLQAKQSAEQAAAAAAQAATASSRCQQQVLELRGRQGQAERRLDTLWQLQETAGENQAALARLQQDLQQTQHKLQQQQHNMAAMQAQIQQLNTRIDTTAEQRLHAAVDELQQRTSATSLEILQVHKALSSQQLASQAAVRTLHDSLQETHQQLQQQLHSHQKLLGRCSSAGQDALGRCEQLRQASVVMDRRMEGVKGQIQDAVQPVVQRLSLVESSIAAVTATAASCSSAVQQSQLSAALAQLSTSAVRQQQELKAVLSGLAHRVELLEGESARQDTVVLQDEYKRQLQQLHADTADAILLATSPLAGQLKAKADITQLSNSTSNLAARIASSEQQMLLGMKSVGDKTAALLQLKADAAAIGAWKQQLGDDMAKLKFDVAQALQRTSSCAVASKHRCTGPIEERQERSATPAAVPDDRVSIASSWPDQHVATNTQQQQQQQQQTVLMPQHSVAECVAAAAAALGAVAEAPASPTASSGTVKVASAVRIPLAAKNASPAAAQDATANFAQAVDTTSSPHPSPSAVPVADMGAQSATGGIHAMISRPLTGAQHRCRKGSSSSSDGIRPFSPVQPWPRHPSAGTAELHSAAQNAKLVKAARDKESAKSRVLHSRGVIHSIVHEKCAPPAPGQITEALHQQLNVMGLRAPDTTAAALAVPGGGTTTEFSAGAVTSAVCAHAALDASSAAATAGSYGQVVDGAGRLVTAGTVLSG